MFWTLHQVYFDLFVIVALSRNWSKKLRSALLQSWKGQRGLHNCENAGLLGDDVFSDFSLQPHPAVSRIWGRWTPGLIGGPAAELYCFLAELQSIMVRTLAPLFFFLLFKKMVTLKYNSISQMHFTSKASYFLLYFLYVTILCIITHHYNLYFSKKNNFYPNTILFLKWIWRVINWTSR